MYQVDYLLHHPFFPQKEKLNVDRLSTHCPVEVEIALKDRPQWGFFVCLFDWKGYYSFTRFGIQNKDCMNPVEHYRRETTKLWIQIFL